ncbi:MAG TPA: efflux RND transporter periplasmic adaptor subunit [Bacteroidales bacterium]|jgi:HlyD family secretion protein|nr:efflux RND transporter periplasmic adaptor subunit [Bacteroidales bacterium]OQB64458.1 MAG: Macrolide export protein MacA [Bacteroidetes bacterium ADurb.Bin145]NMD04008.1 efflux RND transporter periplasmic adaptor subunit [Bacteroidales bacterium]HOU02583.1 efflux RND transporter periplasmic adaptor subunit [Bacteroidales bacterium]HQG62635.1 efflux RND transporter periplasmic adaptor subunit [Bacteroidales bacterium]
MKQKKILRILIIVVVVLLVFAIIGKKAGWFGKAATVKVAVEYAVRREITETITANGKIQPEKEVKITPDVSGEIVELNVREGDQVKKGALLLRIKPDVYISQRDRSLAAISSARARLAQAEAQFTQAELAFGRTRQLFAEQTISKSEFEQAEASYNVAKAEVDAARFSVVSSEASLKEANENLIKTSINAPMSGTVSMLLVELGERVAGTNLMAGTEILRIADLSRMEARVEVNENDIVRVSLGDTALIEVDAYLDRKFKGIVTEIANSAKTTGTSADQVTNFDVKIFVLPESYKDLETAGGNPFRPGMSTTVEILTETKQNILTVPIQSVTTRTDTTETRSSTSRDDIRTIVFSTDGKYAYAKDVKTGIQDNSYIEIISGIEDSVRVVSAPFSAISKKLSDSTLVEIVKKDDLYKEK